MRRLNAAQPGNQRGAWLSSLSQRFASRMFRLCAAILAMLMFIAPTWHTCALGGKTECHEHGAAPAVNPSEYSQEPKVLICGSPNIEEKYTVVCKPSAHPVGEICECPDEIPAVATLNSTHTTHFNENCLARLLWNFPAALVLVFVLFLLWSRRVVNYVSTHIAPPTIVLPSFEARGPPVFSPI